MLKNLKHSWGLKTAGILIVATLLFAGVATATAADLVIARQSEQTAMDPHFSKTGPNQMTALHIFDRLLLSDENMANIPGLAQSWRWIDDLTLEFKLRPGVKFHDGSDFTAEDVVFSMKRVPNVPNSPASYASDVKQVAEMTIVDPLTIRFKAKKPQPLLVNDLSRIYIISHKAAANATTEDFNSGKAAIGTGPYRFIEWVPGERLVLQRNEDYWGPKPAWERVTIKYVSNDAARVAALLSGGADLIDVVPPSDLEQLRKAKNIQLWQTASARMIYLHMDSNRDQTPFATDKSGKALPKNPFKDRRVRLAISKLINRQAIVDRVLYGAAEPAGQMVPEGIFGYDPRVKPEKYDPEGARKLLAAAGYPNGFAITIHGPNDRYLNDGQVLQTVGQFLARGGIDVKVQTMPANVFFKRATKREFSLFLVGYGSSTGEASRGLNNVMATYDKKAGLGSNNRGRYSNPGYDKIIKQALIERDDQKREALLQQATEIGFGDVAIVPLHFQHAIWATRTGFKYIPRRDERTLAMYAYPAK